jgi:Holliday junction resolvasome RuvABC endonuclease subunit
MYFLGVDPGLQGAIALIDSDTSEVKFWDTPVLEVKVGKSLKHIQNAAQIVILLRQITEGREALVAIEKVNAMPNAGSGVKMGATSAFSFGCGYGMWLGILAALELSHQQVHPATWKAAVMAGMTKEKDSSRVRAMELFPRAAKDLARKRDHGRADALLIAYYSKKCHENPMRIAKREDLPMDRTLFG